jgi:hypothetical protein
MILSTWFSQALMVSKFDSEIQLSKVFFAVSSAFAFNIRKKCEYDQNADYDVNFKSVGKVAQKLMKKVSNEKVTEKLSL